MAASGNALVAVEDLAEHRAQAGVGSLDSGNAAQVRCGGRLDVVLNGAEDTALARVRAASVRTCSGAGVRGASHAVLGGAGTRVGELRELAAFLNGQGHGVVGPVVGARAGDAGGTRRDGPVLLRCLCRELSKRCRRPETPSGQVAVSAVASLSASAIALAHASWLIPSALSRSDQDGASALWLPIGPVQARCGSRSGAFCIARR